MYPQKMAHPVSHYVEVTPPLPPRILHCEKSPYLAINSYLMNVNIKLDFWACRISQ